MINWKVRVKNKLFWLAFIPAVLVLICEVGAVFGYTLELTALGNRLAAVVEAVFALLAILGVVTDPTTEGMQDSMLAMTYDKPKAKGM
jgi:phi LC3 family holin